jgi:hypothetical protein
MPLSSFEVHVRAFVKVTFLLVFSCSFVVFAQDSSALEPSADPQFHTDRSPRTPEDARLERDMAKERNKDRQKKLQEDTDKLLKLATELKEYVDKTNEQVLSLDVLKKTDEIEKLARSVRDKMKAGSYDGPGQ